MVEGLRTSQDDAILQITLARSEHGNLVSDEMTIELARLLDGAAEKARFVVLRGEGASFCEGWGVYGKLPPAGSVEAYERLKTYDRVFSCYSAFRSCRVPIVAVVHGAARGFGCAIAALSDITIASDAAVFQLPEISHRILPTMVMSALIDRVPMKVINYLVATSVEVTAARALAYGIVSEVVPAARFEEAVSELCQTLAGAPAPALRGLKEYTRSAVHMDSQGAVDFARNLHATINTSSEMRKQ